MGLQSIQPIYWLDRAQDLERLEVGEKAFELSQIGQHRYPILSGFIISNAIFREFLENLDNYNSLLADFPYSSFHLNVDNPDALQLVAQKSRQAILSGVFSEQWQTTLMEAAQQLQSTHLILSVSLTLPVAIPQGYLDLFSAQVCWCEPEALALGIKETWAQFFSAKSLLYWQYLGIDLDQINLAILVQPIGNAIASGMAQITPESFHIQATWGLEQSLWRGEVLPDCYEIEASTGTVKTQQLGNKMRAYRLSNRLNETDISQNCVESYLLSESEQQQYALDENSLLQLIGYLQQLACQQQYQGKFAWRLMGKTEDQMPRLYFTQAYRDRPVEHSSTPTMKKTDISKSESLLTGLGASPGIAIALSHIISSATFHLDIIPEGRILVAEQINPKWLPLLKKAAGIITDVGGMTSHGAIIARELGIPSIVGVHQATKLLKTGESIKIDGDRGEVHLHWDKELEKQPKSQSKSPKNPKNRAYRTPFPHELIGTKLMVNLSQTSSIAKVKNLPIDGVGLLRSDLLLLELVEEKPLEEWLEVSQHSKFVDHLTESIGKFAKAFSSQPVFYRSLDWMATELERFASTAKGHSWLGQRGTYNYLLDTTLFDLELQALKRIREAGYTNVNLILPFVRSVEEFNFCRRRVEQIGLWQQKSFQLWMMAEVPSVIFILPEYVKAGVQGIAIGSNDLTQLILGSDREEASFFERYNACHPAMLMVFKQLITGAKSNGIPCSICGQAPVQYPELIEQLVQWGITSISVEPEAVLTTYDAIARAERQLLLELARFKKE